MAGENQSRVVQRMNASLRTKMYAGSNPVTGTNVETPIPTGIDKAYIREVKRQRPFANYFPLSALRLMAGLQAYILKVGVRFSQCVLGISLGLLKSIIR
jgi:hypothetical protein